MLACGRVSSPVQLLGALRQLQPRLYSISSAPWENARGVQATIAEVRYNALGADRIGVCSTYVSERIKVSWQSECVCVFGGAPPGYGLTKEVVVHLTWP